MDAYDAHAISLLWANSLWPYRCAADKPDEHASLHGRPQAQETASYRLKRMPDRG
jgi:hypothetical protein